MSPDGRENPFYFSFKNKKIGMTAGTIPQEKPNYSLLQPFYFMNLGLHLFV